MADLCVTQMETTRLEYHGDTSHKFWEIIKIKRRRFWLGDMRQYGYKTRWGRIGSSGQEMKAMQFKWYSTQTNCEQGILLAKRDKIRKGYNTVSLEIHEKKIKKLPDKKDNVMLRVQQMKIS